MPNTPAHLITPPPGHFPLPLTLASIAASSLGLVAAAAGIKWGAAPPPGDALREAWLYVQVMITLGWLVTWPAMTRATTGRILAHEAAAMAVGTLPAFTVAAVLSGVSASGITACLLWQLACGLFAWGTLTMATRRAGVAMILPVIGIALPIAAYLSSEFFSLGSGWSQAIPAIAAARCAQAGASLSNTLWITTGYACAGLVLFGLSSVTRTLTRTTPTPG